MCVDPLGQPLRRLNSNLSLHTDPSYPVVGGYPGMGMRMPLPPPADLGQSRTLPRCFLRQSSDSLASQGFPLGASQQRFGAAGGAGSSQAGGGHEGLQSR